MKQKHASLMGIVAGSIVAVFYGCADDGATSSNDELLSTEDSIAALRVSGQVAQDVAKTCFDTFKTCEASAAAGDTACRDQLKACLPDAPPAAPGCGGAAHGDAGSASHDAGVPAPGDAGRGPRQDDAAVRGGRGAGDQGPAPASRDAGQSRADAGADHTGGGQNQGGFAGGQGQGGFGQQQGNGAQHGACGGFDFPSGALGGCRDDADRSMQHGMGCDGARAQHQSCVAHSFDESLAKLCKKATELCAQQGAPADVCTRLTSACSDLPKSDAGTRPRPDAGN